MLKVRTLMEYTVIKTQTYTFDNCFEYEIDTQGDFSNTNIYVSETHSPPSTFTGIQKLTRV